MNDLEGKLYVLDATHLNLCLLLACESRDEIPFKGAVLSHPEIFGFQDVIKIKNK